MTPMAPRSPCLHPGCPNLVSRGEKGRCPEHRKRYALAIDQRRGTATDRGYDARWGRFRVWYLRQHPLCACGCRGVAVEVHHLVPVSGPDDERFFDVTNVVGLTKACHSRETMKMLNARRT